MWLLRLSPVRRVLAKVHGRWEVTNVVKGQVKAVEVLMVVHHGSHPTRPCNLAETELIPHLAVVQSAMLAQVEKVLAVTT